MFKKMNKVIALLMALILATATLSYACAENLTPYADEVFDSASVSLKTTKKALYVAVTYGDQSTISIASCWLEKKVDGEWQWVTGLPKPSSTSNASLYSREMDYSSYIGSGTFRVGATFNADGHRITRYSNSRSF